MTLRIKAIYYSLASLAILLVFISVFQAYRKANNDLIQMLVALDVLNQASHEIHLEIAPYPGKEINAARALEILANMPDHSQLHRQVSLSSEEVEKLIAVELSFIRIERALNSYMNNQDLSPLMAQIGNEGDKIDQTIKSFMTQIEGKVDVRKRKIERMIYAIYLVVVLTIVGALFSMINFFLKPLLSLSAQIEGIRSGRKENLDFKGTGDEIGRLADFTSTVINDLKTKSAEVMSSKRELELQYHRQLALSEILRLSNERISLDEFFEGALQSLASLECLKPEARCGIFLTEGTPQELVLRKSLNFPPEVLKTCARVPVGKCICGRAAELKECMVVDAVDHRHDIVFEGMPPHGHYCGPILSEGELIGVLVIYLPTGKQLRPLELSYLADVVGILSDVLRRKKLEEHLNQLAITDPLTGCFNRRYFLEQGTSEFQRSKRYGRAFSVLMLDIDHFKNVNDTFGHAKGDEVLISLVKTCKAVLRKNDVLGRMGGEEFAMIFVETQRSEAFKLAERLRGEISGLMGQTEANAVRITISIGISVARDEDESFEAVLARADKALYEAKNAGRDCVRECT